MTRDAVNGALRYAVATRDQLMADAWMVLAATMGWADMAEATFRAAVAEAPPEVHAWWHGPCDCGVVLP